MAMLWARLFSRFFYRIVAFVLVISICVLVYQTYSNAKITANVKSEKFADSKENDAPKNKKKSEPFLYIHNEIKENSDEKTESESEIDPSGKKPAAGSATSKPKLKTTRKPTEKIQKHYSKKPTITTAQHMEKEKDVIGSTPPSPKPSYVARTRNKQEKVKVTTVPTPHSKHDTAKTEENLEKSKQVKHKTKVTETVTKQQPSVSSDKTGNTKNSQSTEADPACEIPFVDPFHKELMDYVFDETDPVCKKVQKEYVLFDFKDSTIWLNEKLFELPETPDKPKEKPVKCSYMCLYKGFGEVSSGDEYEYGNTIRITKERKKVTCEMPEVTCWQGSTQVFIDIFPNPIFLKEKQILDSSVKRPSVAFYLLEATTQAAMIRNIPKTVKLLKSWGAINMESHVKVGSNSLPNFAAMMSGLRIGIIGAQYETGDEDYDAYAAKYHDDLAMVWKNFSRNGYVTLMQDESPFGDVFNYLAKGFQRSPTLHYSRAMFIRQEDYWLDGGGLHPPPL